jgi:hypothetical protein
LILDRDHHLGLPVLRLVTLCIHAIATTPAGLVKLIRSYPLTRIGLPLFCGRSAPALAFSRPAQRSLSLRPACSPGLHETLCTRGFSGFIASTTAPIVTGRNDPVPGWDLHPLLSNAFSRRTHFLANFTVADTHSRREKSAIALALQSVNECLGLESSLDNWLMIDRLSYPAEPQNAEGYGKPNEDQVNNQPPELNRGTDKIRSRAAPKAAEQ